ncbi:IS21-like element helper ATPase IstB [Herpetosiphon gulosus]|uniref:IS21 family transposase ISAzo12 n=1 Tax=Herpetosiphon gulosus TaxID=1973496 RepID=A0ABP9X879_9CHLR
MELTHQLSGPLKQLRLSGMLETLVARTRQAVDGKWSYEEFLARLVEDEVERRAQKQLVQRLRRANVQTSKTLEGFDFSFNPGINRQQILALASGEYIRQKRNVLICGPAGVGKSHLAQALGHEACRQGYPVVYVNTHKLVQHLHSGRADGSQERRLESYLRPAVLILDDFGLRALSAQGAEDLYDVICERYEQGSIVLTSNRAPTEWPELFGNPLLASAGLDRLAHHAETVVMTGRSYRAAGRRGSGEPLPSADQNEAANEG